MVAEGTPVPTPTRRSTTVSWAFSKAAGMPPEGVYRRGRNCLMNNLHKTDEFCPVCSKAIVDYIDFLCK